MIRSISPMTFAKSWCDSSGSNRQRSVRRVRSVDVDRTRERNQEYRVYPYLLRRITPDRPNRVWGIDVTYISASNADGCISWLSSTGIAATS